jgi:PAS domain S-box-containing protein
MKPCTAPKTAARIVLFLCEMKTSKGLLCMKIFNHISALFLALFLIAAIHAVPASAQLRHEKATAEDGSRIITSDELKKDETKRHESSPENSIPASSILAGVGGLTLLVLILFAWNRTLRKMVNSRVAELKAGEETLRENEAFVKTLMNAIPVPIFYKDIEGRYTGFNSSYEEFFGLSQEDLIGKSVFEIAPKELAEVYHAKDLELFRNQGQQVYESQVKNARGIVRDVIFHKAAFSNTAGQVCGLIGAILDITDRIEKERALLINEHKFKAFFEQGYYFAGIMDLDGTLTDVNNTALQFSGASKDDVIGKPFWETPWWSHSQELQEKLRRAITSAANGALVRFEATHPATDGTLHYIDFSIRPVKDQAGSVIFIVPEGHDITERKKAEEALEESRERYRGLSEAGFESIFFSEKGICIEQNKNASLTFGYSDLEAIGRCGTEWIVPDDRDLVMQHMVSGYEEPYEVTALRKDVSTFPALIRAKMMHYKGKDVRVTSLSDISDRKKAEEERLNLERQLLYAQKLESLGILSGGIAHDFNNLLQALLGNLDLALMRLPQETPARKNIDQAMKAGRHAAKLTSMMLAYTGKCLFVIKPLNLTELVEDNATMLDAAIPKSITLEQHLDHTLPIIRADAGQLQQVIMNLITNAAEAIGDQCGKIKLSTGVKEFDQAALNSSRLEEKQPTGRYVWMKVCDNGCGMSGDTLQKLFDPFFTTKFTGRGLGMSAVLGIIRAHKGAFLVESRLDVGTTIQVLFPIADDQPTGSRQVTESEAAPKKSIGRSVKVLVVDDEDMIRAVSIAMLEELGFETLAAAGGEEALAIFRRDGDSIDVVLLDQVMPGMDGATVFRKLRAIRPGIKVLLASGFSQQEVSERFSGLGLNGFLPKPYTLKNLTSELSRVLEGGNE